MRLLSTLAAAPNPVDHVVNQPLHQSWAQGDLFGLHGVWLWSAHVGNLILAGALTVLILLFAARRIRTGDAAQGNDRYVTKNSFAHMIEVICVYLRDNTVRPLLGKRTDTFMPFLWTFFFFILINNLLGLTPITDILHFVDQMIARAKGVPVAEWPHYHIVTGIIGATATQNIFVTAALAILAALIINIAGVMELGVGGYVKHLTAGTPAYLWPLMIPIEILGTVIKPVALALRLFANMTAGHILVAVLFMFAIMGLGLLIGEAQSASGEVTHSFSAGGLVMGGAISVLSVVAAIAIYFLELFVAFLQAFVFMFLTTVFISQLSHHGEHEHHEGHGHEHAHA